MIRVIFDIVLFISIFIFPWWLTVLIALLGLFAFKDYYEFVGAGAIMHAIFRFFPALYLGIGLVAFFFLIQELKKRLILYKK
ncbi:MAG: hypothetical protein U9R00_03090 [Patescibacteria group bacterium]|nr:hypothetical protein [Patescibacteria group bacterium]